MEHTENPPMRVVVSANFCQAQTLLHRYILIPKGEEGDKTVAMLAYSLHNGSFSQP